MAALLHRLKRGNDEGCFVVLALGTILAIPAAIVLVLWPTSKDARHVLYAACFIAVLSAWIIIGQFLARRRPRAIADPVFGELESTNRRAWYGLWDAARPIEIVVFADDAGPTEHQRQLFAQWKDRLDELQQPVEAALFEEYNKCRRTAKDEYEEFPELLKSFDSDYPAIDTPSDIWRLALLIVIEVRGDNDIDIGLRYSMDWGDAEHGNIHVALKDWRVIDVGRE